MAADLETPLVHDARGPNPDCIFQDGFDCPPVPAGLSASGSVLDYWTLSPVTDVLVISLTPALIDISDAGGQFFLEGFDPNSSILIKASRAPDYRQTNNVENFISNESLDVDIFTTGESDLARQFASVTIVEQQDMAIVIAEMRDSDGLPLEGIPIADVSLTDDAMLPIGDGPYYFGIMGDIVDPAVLNVSAAFGGRGARVAFLNVPLGPATLSILLPPPETNIFEEFEAEHDTVHLLIVD
jgi:hypothetical protein